MNAAAPRRVFLTRPCSTCNRPVDAEHFSQQLGQCETCAIARIGTAARVGTVLPMRGAGVPVAPRTPQQRLAAGLAAEPAPRGTVLPFGEHERRRRQRELSHRILAAIATFALVVGTGLAFLG